MNEIKCPNCGKIFKIDEMDYASIVKQIRDHEFEKELKREEDNYNKDKKREHVLVYKNRDIIFYTIVNNKKLLS